jgi:hypothetical protein
VRPHDREIDAISAQVLEGKSTVAQIDAPIVRSRVWVKSGCRLQETNPLLHDRRLLGQPSERHGRYGSKAVILKVGNDFRSSLLDIGPKALPIDRSLDEPRRLDSVVPQGH